MQLRKETMRHGTLHTYKYWRCRCYGCRVANTTYQKNYYERKGLVSINTCRFGGCEELAGKWKVGLCFSHYELARRLIKQGIRTKEEIELACE